MLPPYQGWLFCFAVDASWTKPLKAVKDPMKDFGKDANCPEAWNISVSDSPIGDGLTNMGGSTVLNIDIYDHQGKETTYPVLVECPQLFDGQVKATWVSDSTGFSSYTATIGNTKTAHTGVYKVLVSKESDSDDPIHKPWKISRHTKYTISP